MMRSSKKHRPYATGNSKLDREIKALVAKVNGDKYGHYIEDIFTTGVKIIEDSIDPADVRMLTIALKELRYALRVFLPYEHIRKVAIFGSARLPETCKDYKLAKQFAQAIVREGWMVITGAASGIMSAGNEGAGRENSFGVNIQLPFEQEANHTIADDQKLIHFKYFFTRKLIFMRESDATILFPGGFGTHDEGFETLTLVQTGKAPMRPIVCMDAPGSKYWKSFKYFIQYQLGRGKLIDHDDMELIHFTHNVDDAARYITQFYHNYHSSRYIGDMCVIRVKRAISPKLMEKLNQNYREIIKKGKIAQTPTAFPEEAEETSAIGLHRIYFHFTKRRFSRLHALIRDLNKE